MAISQNLLLTVALAPLAGALIAGLAGKTVGQRGAHFFTILGVFIAFVGSCIVLSQVAGGERFNQTLYQWAVVGKTVMEVGFMVDGLTAKIMVVVTIVSHTGAKYLTQMFNDLWVSAHGFEDRQARGDISDLIAKRYSDGGVITIGPDDTLLTAYNRMRSADISQLPVVDHSKLVGILDESDVLSAVAKAHDGEGFATKVGGAMTRNVKTLESHQPMSALTAVFERDEVAVVMDGDELLGLITRVDLINHLRRTA